MISPRDGGRRRWVALARLRHLALAVHHGWEGLPSRARRAWWVTLGTGLLLVECLTLGLVWLGKHLEATGRLRWEYDALRWIDAQPYLSFNFGLWLEGLGNGFVLWFVMLYAAAEAAWRGRTLVSLSVLTGYTLMYLPIVTGWAAWDRARPRLIADGIGSPAGVLHSFPSGHTIQAVFAYGFLAYLWYRLSPSRAERAVIGLLYLLVLAAVTAGRLRLGAHWPTDVVGGLMIGATWLAGALTALRRSERARDAGNAGPGTDI